MTIAIRHAAEYLFREVRRLAHDVLRCQDSDRYNYPKSYHTHDRADDYACKALRT